MRRYKTMKDVKQLHTNIKFKRFSENYKTLEIHFYQSMIRFLELSKYKYIEHTVPGDGHYIFTVTGMYKLDIKTKKFGRVHESDLSAEEILEQERLTYFQKRKEYNSTKDALSNKYSKPLGEPPIRMTPELRGKIVQQLHRSNKELAKEFKCSVSTIFLLRKKEEQKNEI